jgi:hypothetical protein
MESASKHMQIMTSAEFPSASSDSKVNKVTSSRLACPSASELAKSRPTNTSSFSPSAAPCHSCGGPHRRSVCKFRDALCHACNKKGHIHRVCRSHRERANAIIDFTEGSSSNANINEEDKYDYECGITHILRAPRISEMSNHATRQQSEDYIRSGYRCLGDTNQ